MTIMKKNGICGGFRSFINVSMVSLYFGSIILLEKKDVIATPKNMVIKISLSFLVTLSFLYKMLNKMEMHIPKDDMENTIMKHFKITII